MSTLRISGLFLLAMTVGSMVMPAAMATGNEVSPREGQAVFMTYCILCHGESGEGDGRMARLVEDPPPANLTVSTLSPLEVKRIITRGGEAIGRSASMPAWKDVIAEQELDNLVQFVMSLRERP